MVSSDLILIMLSRDEFLMSKIIITSYYHFCTGTNDFLSARKLLPDFLRKRQDTLVHVDVAERWSMVLSRMRALSENTE